MGADDLATLYVDDDLVASPKCCHSAAASGTLPSLSAGYHKFVIRLMKAYDSAWVSMSLKVNGTVAPLSRYYPMAPGVPVPIVLTANGVPAQQACGAATVTITPPSTPGSVVPVPEATSIPLASGTCGYMYSSHITAVLVSAVGLAPEASTASGMGPSGINSPSPELLQVRSFGGCARQDARAHACMHAGRTACVHHGWMHVLCSVQAAVAGGLPACHPARATHLPAGRSLVASGPSAMPPTTLLQTPRGCRCLATS